MNSGGPAATGSSGLSAIERLRSTRVGVIMTMMLKILDQTPGIGTVEVREVSAREIVRARVEAEVARHNSAEVSPGFVRWATPAGPERALNGARRERRRPLDLERQVEVAFEAL